MHDISQILILELHLDHFCAELRTDCVFSWQRTTHQQVPLREYEDLKIVLLLDLYPYHSELHDTRINILRSFEVEKQTGVPST